MYKNKFVPLEQSKLLFHQYFFKHEAKYTFKISRSRLFYLVLAKDRNFLKQNPLKH